MAASAQTRQIIHVVSIADAPVLSRAWTTREAAERFQAQVHEDHPDAVTTVRSMELWDDEAAT